MSINVPPRKSSSKAGSYCVSKIKPTGRNLKLEIEYDGTQYHGWQVQNDKAARFGSYTRKTIQYVLEKVLKKVLQEDVKLTVAGRTDSGVHALSQVANFKSSTRMPFEKLRWALNCLLPEDIKVTRIKTVPLGFNSRFCAKSKLYRYTILNRKYSSALLANRVYFFHHPLDVSLMRREARELLGRHNFASFQAAELRQRNPVRTIKQIKISKIKDFLYIDIQADSFLYNMVRSIAGTLLEIGRGRFAAGSMKKILKGRNRRLAGPTLPAKGLCLVKVRY
ncbi:MAG: tRNA pseudouridine(38-40) synthase TruA [Candidatus Omnitrophica bacterium]|nr:tRNA pseudouridine(38-40) synthase TruA [Candidatus Omnitrophota bacterium]